MSKLKKFLAYKDLSKEQKDLIKSIESSFVGEIWDKPIKKTGFSASSLFFSEGRCPRRWDIVFDGAPESYAEVEYYNLRAMHSGSAAHDHIQSFIKAKHPNVEVELEFTRSAPKMRGFIDLWFPDQNVPGEIKTANDRGFQYREESMEGADYHLMQLAVYCYEKQADWGLLLYENRNDFKPLIIPVLMTDELMARVERLYAWMREIEAAREAGEVIKTFPGKRSNSKICSTCPVKKVCDEREEGTYSIELQEKYGLEDEG